MDDVENHTPVVGHNVVGVNSYAHGDDPSLYLVSHHADLAEAEKARAENEKATGDVTHVYSTRNSGAARAPIENDATTSASVLEVEA
jgi:hypothetical protein